MASFLRLSSRGNTIYDASVDGGGNVTTNPVGLPDLSVVDQLQLLDPSTGDVVLLTFSVFASSLRSGGDWQKFDFNTRCFLTPRGTNKFAPVHVELELDQGTIKLKDLTIFSQSATSSSPQVPVPLTGLGLFVFVPPVTNLGALAFETPEVLSKLGLGIAEPGTPGTVALSCTPTALGTIFSVDLPLDDGDQKLIPFGIEFNTKNYPGLNNSTFGGAPALQFAQSEPVTSGHEPFWIVEADLLPAALVFDNWNSNVVAPYLTGLNTVRSGLPVSFMPQLAVAAATDAQNQVFTVAVTLIDRTNQQAKPANLVLRDPLSPLQAGALNIVGRTVSLGDSLNCIATFPNLKCAGGSSLQALCTLLPLPADQTTAFCQTTSGFYFPFQHLFEPFQPPSTQPRVRMGALDLILPAPSGAATIPSETGVIHGSFRSRRVNGDDVPSDLVRLDYLSIKLAVASLGVGGQDDAPGSEYAPPNQPYPRCGSLDYQREPPLQIPRSDFPSTGAYYYLDVTETCYELTSQTLTLQIEQQQLSSSSGGNGSLDVLVVDTEPFLIARVQVPDYQESLAAAITDQIASWDNNAADASWQISAGTQNFQLTLPPQGVTEAMHKQIGSGDITPGTAIDFRFTPPAEFALLASPLPQRFVEVPWNLRRVLGYPGQTAPGAVVNSATFELLYGLSASLNANPGLMLAEIGARLGNFAAAPPPDISWQHSDAQETGYDVYTNYWATILPQLRTRLAVLEPWSAAQPAGLTLTETDNLTFNLRSEADLAYPIPAADVTAPIPKGIPQGTLKGSFSWAFDSERIYQSIWTDPASVTCEASGLEFSALGGWGEFTARFANGKTSIIASVRMGRIQKLTIEQIGRIGNFWNRAKLVITYERTVAPTDQFAAIQMPFLGNPILRKTAEYIQILEKKRSPAVTDTTAAYSACEFPEGDPPKIPVDSNWGENIGATGYRIPLWRPGAVPASVYTKPIVRLHFQAAVSDSTTYSDLWDPEKLYFYTDTNPDLDSNTDSWPKQLGVDYGYVTQDALTPVDPTSIATSAGGNVQNFKSPEEPWTQPLLGAFTYHLQPPSLAANLTASVSSTPIGAVLRTITIMRGLDGSAVLGSSEPYAKALPLPDYVSNVLRPTISVIPAGATAQDLLGKWNEWTKAAIGRVEDLKTALSNVPPVTSAGTALCQAFTAQIKNQFGFLSTQIENEVAGLLSGVFGFLVPSTPPPDFTIFKKSWNDGHGNGLYPTLQGELRYTGSEMGAVAAKLTAEVDPLFTQASSTLTTLSTNLQALINAGATDTSAALQDVQTAAAFIESILAPADAVIAGILNPITGGKLDQVRQGVSKMRSDAANAATTAIAVLNASSGTVLAGIQNAKSAVDNCSNLVTTGKTAADGAIANLTRAAHGLQTTLEAKLASIDTKLAVATDWNAFKTAAAAELTAISTGIQATVQTHMNELSAGLVNYANVACQQILQTDLTELLGNLQSLFDPAAFQRFFDNLKASIGSAINSGAEAATAVENYLHGFEASTASFLNAVVPVLPAPVLPQPVTDAAMFLLRGFGDVPKVPQLNFGDVTFSAFRFAGLANNLPIQLPQVNLTPLVGWANNIGDTANAIAIGLPSCNLGDALTPFKLSNFDLSSFLPNIGGLSLTNLFQGLRMPFDLPSDPSLPQYVQVTHGEDPQSRSAWVNLAMKFEIDDAEMFSYFGVTLVLEKATFAANARVSAQAGQPVTRAISGSILGDWSLTVGGMDIVILEQCTLTFDQSGHFGFDVSPAKVKLQGVLNFLADIISDFFSGDGFTTSVTAAGVQTLLDLPLPDIQSGTFGIANLRLLARFGIAFPPSFQIQLGLGIATLEQPFTLTVFILGGAGYLSLDVAYFPDSNIIDATFDIGIFASASLAVSLGPISGGIYAYFGITVSYEAKTGTAPDLQIALILMFSGQVTLLGFLSVSLMLSLSGSYDSTSHTLTGTGTVSYSIQIGPFFSINVSASVSYTYSNDPPPPGLNRPQVDPALYDAAATEYLSMFLN